MRTVISSGVPLRGLALGFVLCSVFAQGCALTRGGGRGRGDSISGVITDPTGAPVSFAKVSLAPEWTGDAGEEQSEDALRGLAVSTESGNWWIDHLSDDMGGEDALAREEYYVVTVYKTGFHPWQDTVFFEKGTLNVDVILYPDNVNIDDTGNVVDTSQETGSGGGGVVRGGGG